MSAIESLLNRLEEKMTPAEPVRNPHSLGCSVPSVTDLSVVEQASPRSAHTEEEKLRRKLSELAGNLSDKGLSSDDEPGKKPLSLGKGAAGFRAAPPSTLDSLRDKELSSSSDDTPTAGQKVGGRPAGNLDV